MKIIANISKIKDLDLYNSLDGIIINTKFSTFYESYLNKEEIHECIYYCIKNGIRAILNIDKIFNESELNEISLFLDAFIDYDIDFMFSDFAILKIFKDKFKDFSHINFSSKLIYSASTYICNLEDIKYYKDLNIDVFLSRELSLSNVIDACKYDNVILQAFGYFPIYNSYRNVISLYNKHLEKEGLEKVEFNEGCVNSYKLKEEKREELYNILEYANKSTVITSAKKICIYKELIDIMPSCIYIDTFGLDSDYKALIFEMYSRVKKLDKLDLSEYDNLLLKDKDIDSSMLYIKNRILGD